ncbi:MAG: hypothetical protein GY950_18575, partial [bacterium]|nr:hypothetical protein [bacterium]
MINKLFGTVLTVLFVLTGFAFPLEEGQKIKVKKGEDTLFVFREISSGMNWKANSTNYEIKISRQAESYKFKMDSG